MPDYKQEMKRILGEHLITGNDAEIRREVMEIANGLELNDASSYYNDRTFKLADRQRELEEIIRDKKDRIEEEYNREVGDAELEFDNTILESGYNYDISIIEKADKIIKNKTAEWNSYVSGKIKDRKGNDIPDISTVRNNILKEQETLKKEDRKEHDLTETDTYSNLPDLQQAAIETYMIQFNRIANIEDSEYKQSIYNSALEVKEAAIKSAAETRNNKMAAIEEFTELNQVKEQKTENNKKWMKICDYQNKILPKAEAVNSDTLTEESKKSGLDLLAAARAEYRNNCSWWDRLWANILSPERFSKAAYVAKINAYKEALKETGVNDKEIADADPDKSAAYTKDKDGKYVPSNRLDADAIDELNNLANDEEPVVGQKKDKVRVAEVNNAIGKDTGSPDNGEVQKGVKDANLNKPKSLNK
ncbi:MAG: hypothetical protein MJ068_05265 [Clostridia bacterium]|nr:hypothetical protein [Clostridia bacterium]